MKIINYMAHEVDACGMKYSPSGHVARVATTLLKVDEIDGVPVYSAVNEGLTLDGSDSDLGQVSQPLLFAPSGAYCR